MIRIDPRALYKRIALRAVAQGILFDQFPNVIVDLKADDTVNGWSSEQTLQIDFAHTDVTWSVRAQPNAAVKSQRRFRYADTKGTETVVDWDYVEPGILLIGDPFPDVLDVQIVGSARFGVEVERLIVELRMAPDTNKVTTKVLTASSHSPHGRRRCRIAPTGPMSTASPSTPFATKYSKASGLPAAAAR